MIIDGAVNGLATITSRSSEQWRKLQTGFVRNYAVGILGGAALVVLYVVLRAG